MLVGSGVTRLAVMRGRKAPISGMYTRVVSRSQSQADPRSSSTWAMASSRECVSVRTLPRWHPLRRTAPPRHRGIVVAADRRA